MDIRYNLNLIFIKRILLFFVKKIINLKQFKQHIYFFRPEVCWMNKIFRLFQCLDYSFGYICIHFWFCTLKFVKSERKNYKIHLKLVFRFKARFFLNYFRSKYFLDFNIIVQEDFLDLK